MIDTKIFQFPNYELASLTWGPHTTDKHLLFLHGWMDNAYSFYHFFQEEFPIQSYAIEHIGHGFSSHIPSIQPSIHLVDWLTPLIDLIQYQLKGDIYIVAHSFSGGLATLLAGILPHRIRHLFLLDPVIWAADPETDFLSSYRKILSLRNSKGEMPAPKGFVSYEAAIKARLENRITPEPVVKILAIRGLMKGADGLWYWRGDPRLRFSKLFLLSKDQIERVWKETQTRVTLFPSADPRYGLKGLIAEYSQSPFCQVIPCETSHYVHFEKTDVILNQIRQILQS